MDSRDVFRRFQQNAEHRISQTYSGLIADINDCLNKVLNTAISNAEDLEAFFRHEIRKIMKITDLKDNIVARKMNGIHSNGYKIKPEHRMKTKDDNFKDGFDSLDNIKNEMFDETLNSEAS